MKNEIRVAICGCHGKVDKFGRMINGFPESRVTAVYDGDPEKARRIAAQLECPAAADYRDILNDPEVDGVVIASTNDLHAEMVIAAAEAGKHIFLEKPLCMRLEEAYRIRDAVKTAGIKFFMSDPFVDPPTVFDRQMIASGRLGKLVHVHLTFCGNAVSFFVRSKEQIRDSAAGQGGGVMMDSGGHALHVLHYLLGRPVKVFAVLGYHDPNARAFGWEKHASVLLEYPDELTVSLECGIASTDYVNRLEISGIRGALVDQGTLNHGYAVRYRLFDITEEEAAGMRFMDAAARNPWIAVARSEMPEDPDDHIRYWIRMMAEDLPNEAIGADTKSTHGMGIEAAVEVMEMIDGIYRSAAAGTAVTL